MVAAFDATQFISEILVHHLFHLTNPKTEMSSSFLMFFTILNEWEPWPFTCTTCHNWAKNHFSMIVIQTVWMILCIKRYTFGNIGNDAGTMHGWYWHNAPFQHNNRPLSRLHNRAFQYQRIPNSMIAKQKTVRNSGYSCARQPDKGNQATRSSLLQISFNFRKKGHQWRLRALVKTFMRVIFPPDQVEQCGRGNARVWVQFTSSFEGNYMVKVSFLWNHL